MNVLRQFVALVALALLCGCSSVPGRPQQGSEIVAPSEILDFATLYAQNCAACHGAEGHGGVAISLADPDYLAIVDKEALRKVTANGVARTSMPAFAESAGGMLTDKQIDVIVSEVKSRWAKPGILDGANPPSYAAKSAGNVHSGELAYGKYCASCHGSSGQGTAKGSAITNDSFLALVSDQGLRTIVITGRPELGAPDWRGNVRGQPMSDEEVTDVVAWLVARRVQNPGQPYSPSNVAQK